MPACQPMALLLAFTACARPPGAAPPPVLKNVWSSPSTRCGRIAWVSVYGTPNVATPNIDALARQGAWAPQATVHAPPTRPSHVSLFTGLYPAGHHSRRSWRILVGSRPSLMPTNGKLQRVCISTWSFHTFFETDRNNPAKVLMDVRDFPEMIADKYHVHNLEIVLPHFLATDPPPVRDFKTRLEKTRSRVVNMPLDFGVLWNTPAISSTDANERDAAIAMYQKGIDTAHELGSPSVRCDPGIVNLDDPSLTIDAYRRLAAYAAGKGIKVVVENHGEISRNPDVLVKILKAAGVGALPDFGNFPDEETREHGLRLMFPLAGDIAHAKLREGQDFARCMRIARESGFAGVFSIEAAGRGDAYVEVQQIVDAVVANL